MGLVGGRFFSEDDLRADGLRELSQKERKQLQTVLLGMLKDVISLCKKHNFCYMLVYGSALGAVRHGGFIPWDDDLDIGMLRKDYIPFLETVKKEYGDKYEVVYPGNTSYNSSISALYVFGKIYLKGSDNLDYYVLSSPFRMGIYLDIFPIENVPRNILKYRIYRYVFSILLFHIIRSVRFYEFSKIPSFELSFRKYSIYVRKVFRLYQLRCILGFVFSFFTYNKWCQLYDKWVSLFPESGFLGIPTVPKHYLKIQMQQSVYIPVKIGIFEGEEVCLPGNTHEHLVSVYGNYMQIPEESRKECHTVVEID
jgi:lipopolysaccharide cholinephosphotransferase